MSEWVKILSGWLLFFIVLFMFPKQTLALLLVLGWALIVWSMWQTRHWTSSDFRAFMRKAYGPIGGSRRRR